jgi:trk system potassium uptake protein TrkA
MDIAFPESCRIIMIVRGQDEILPNGTTILHKGDILLMAGIKEREDQMIDLITK